MRVAAAAAQLAVGMAALAAPVVAEARFAPRLRRDYVVSVEETRHRTGPVQHYRIAHAVRFERRDGAFVATQTLLPPPAATAPPDAQSVLQAVYAPLIGVPLRIRLDRDGHVTAIEDEAAAWARWRAAVAGSGAPGRREPALAALDAMSPAERQGELIEPLLTLVASDAAARRAGVRRVTLPGPGGDPLTGEEATHVEKDVTRQDIAATGDRAVAGGAAGAVAIDRHLRIDRRTGLLIDMREDTRITTAVGGEAAVLRIVRYVKVS